MSRLPMSRSNQGTARQLEMCCALVHETKQPRPATGWQCAGAITKLCRFSTQFFARTWNFWQVF